MVSRVVTICAALVVLTASGGAFGDFELLEKPVDLDARFPDALDYEIPLDSSTGLGAGSDWTGVREVRVLLALPDDVPRGTTLLCYLKDAQWKWYQYEPTGTLKSGRPNLIRIDMRPGVESWLPRGHNRLWDGYVAHRISGFGIKVFNNKPWTGKIRIESITARTGLVRLRPLAVTDFRTNADEVPRGEKYEMTFDLTRVYENPFDPDEIDIRALFTSPSGKKQEQFGFHYREYVRRQSPLGYERLTPIGKSCWKVRWTPTEAGTWTVQLRIWDRHNEKWLRAADEAREDAKKKNTRPKLPDKDAFFLELKPVTFTCTPSGFHGFLRVDPKDPFFFAYSDGTFFYPVGQMLRSPIDLRPPFNGYETKAMPGEGTFAFERMMKRLSENGVNFIRVWMGVWWVGLEAPRDYAPGYEGVGRYNMMNAWKLDHILDEAHKLGMTVKLNLNNHGQFTRNIDHEWYECCYNRMNGGMLKRPWEFWDDPEAERFYKRRLRYVVARWAYSPEIMGWEMWNEVDLTEGFNAQVVRDWHRRFGRYLKQIDPWDHMISTHFCHDEAAGSVYSLPEIEFTPGDLYVSNIVTSMRNKWLEKKGYNKPTFISEFGRADYNKQMEVNFHGGLWASSIVPMAGTAMVWWWNWIDDEDLYFHYKAVARFNRDARTGKLEDRRGKDWQLSSADVRRGDDEHPALRVLGRQTDTEAHLWIYDTLIFNQNDGRRYADAPSFVGAVLHVGGLRKGKYRVEFCDTTTGEVTGTETVDLTDKRLEVPLLKVQVDLAVKIKPAEPTR
ncbi:MAG TPA: DUF5060 domain-containing protein [Planctomycetota bacterium]|nr:DUF5060 domain-containing protein [Planctomycetota bacterium]